MNPLRGAVFFGRCTSDTLVRRFLVRFVKLANYTTRSDAP
jgi:hypothetical protein